MKDVLVTILVVMAGALLLNAMRLAWQRMHKRRTGTHPIPPNAVSAVPMSGSRSREPEPAPAPGAAKRILLEDYESVPESYAGVFHSPLDKLISDTWLAVWYVVATLALVALLAKFVYASVLFIALQVPLIVLCTYVVSPDVNVARRLPFNWIVTAMLALFSYLAQPALARGQENAWHNAVGWMVWVLIVYWLVSALGWSIKIAQRGKPGLDYTHTLKLFALLCATWGAVFEIATLGIWIVISPWQDWVAGAPSMEALFTTVTSIKTSPALRFLPLEIVVASLLLLTALRMKDDQYVPRSLDEFLQVRDESFFAPFVMALRIPVWIMIVILEFAMYFSRLAREAFVDFAKTFMIRLTFIIMTFALAPILFYLGHALMLNALHLAAAYYHAAFSGVIDGLKHFLVINIMMLAALCFYVLATPPLAARFRRVHLSDFVPALRQELIVQGKAYVLALGQAFSLLGALAFAIPVVTMLPGKPGFGVFSFLYALIVLVGFSWYVTAREEEEEADDEEEEIEEEVPEENTPEEPAIFNPSQGDDASERDARGETTRE